MSTATALAPEPALGADGADPLAYRAIHTGAILGLLLGLVSVVTVLTAGNSLESTLLLAPIPVAGLLISLKAWRRIARERDQYTGERFAMVGTVLSALFLVASLGYGGFVHATEVPEGYARTTFADLKPHEVDVAANRLVPKRLEDQIGERIFIKGYIRPDSVTVRHNLKDFLLVRDSNECCFGDLTKVQYYDQIAVDLADGITTDFSRRVFRVGGVLSVRPGDPLAGTPVVYTLKADYVR
jgi:hypothetical protein